MLSIFKDWLGSLFNVKNVANKNNSPQTTNAPIVQDNRQYAQNIKRQNNYYKSSKIVSPDSDLSTQAIEILRKAAEKDPQELFLDTRRPNNLVLHLNGTVWNTSEPRFLRDDLAQMEQFGMISKKHETSGVIIFGLTRKGLSFTESK